MSMVLSCDLGGITHHGGAPTVVLRSRPRR